MGQSNAVATLDGTSMSSPHVAGVAALLIGQVETYSAADVSKQLADIATKNLISGSLGQGSPNLLLFNGVEV